jgi:DNA modification methylase
MNIIQVSLDKIIPYARNPRVNTQSAVDKVKASIHEFGWRQPIVVDKEYIIIAGHTRYLAAKQLGLSEVPVHVAENLTPAQIQAYRITDNRSAQESKWDDELLKIELFDLKSMDYDLGLTGFDAVELGKFFGTKEQISGDTEAEVDNADELRKKYDVVSGQLWQLGDHRLLCGDSTNAEDVKRVMQGETADLCFTSPPYGQQRDYRDGGKVSDWDALMQGVFGNLPMSESGQVLVNLGLIHRDNEWQPYWEGWIQWMRSEGWRRFGWYVWDQGAGMMGDWSGRFAPSFEFVFHFNKKSVKPNKWIDKQEESIKVNTGGGMRNKTGVVGGRSNPEASLQPTKIPDSVIRVNRVAGSDIDHPAMFPVNLSEYAIRSWHGLVYEPFSGSGTTIIAGENLGRQVRAIEISPAYVAVALERFRQHTQIEPVLCA